MLATWLVEFYLSKCNELDDVVASESVSHDVDDLQAERAILEDDLRHFFETYKVGGRHFYERNLIESVFVEQSRPSYCLRTYPRTRTYRHVFILCDCRWRLRARGGTLRPRGGMDKSNRRHQPPGKTLLPFKFCGNLFIIFLQD